MNIGLSLRGEKKLKEHTHTKKPYYPSVIYKEMNEKK